MNDERPRSGAQGGTPAPWGQRAIHPGGFYTKGVQGTPSFRIHPWPQTLKSSFGPHVGVAVGDVVQLRAQLARSMVEYLVESEARLATPDDPLAKLRREVLRGLRAAQSRNGFP